MWVNSFCEKSVSPFAIPQIRSIIKDITDIFSLIELLYEHIMITAISSTPMPAHWLSRIGSRNTAKLSKSVTSTPSIRNTSSIMYAPFLTASSQLTTKTEVITPESAVISSVFASTARRRRFPCNASREKPISIQKIILTVLTSIASRYSLTLPLVFFPQ